MRVWIENQRMIMRGKQLFLRHQTERFRAGFTITVAVLFQIKYLREPGFILFWLESSKKPFVGHH